MLCYVTFLVIVATESSNNEYTIPSSSLGWKHFWAGEGEILEKLGSVLSYGLSVTWNSVTCDIKKGHFDNLTTRMPAYFLTTAGKWMANYMMSTTNNKNIFFFFYFMEIYDFMELYTIMELLHSLHFCHFFLVEFS